MHTYTIYRYTYIYIYIYIYTAEGGSGGGLWQGPLRVHVRRNEPAAIVSGSLAVMVGVMITTIISSSIMIITIISSSMMIIMIIMIVLSIIMVIMTITITMIEPAAPVPDLGLDRLAALHIVPPHALVLHLRALCFRVILFGLLLCYAYYYHYYY